jgi:chaperonin GroEL
MACGLDHNHGVRTFAMSGARKTSLRSEFWVWRLSEHSTAPAQRLLREGKIINRVRPLTGSPERQGDFDMSHKNLLFRTDAREKVLRGATALADAVRVTLGPKSRCVLIEKKWGRPVVCNDGVTIAKEFELKDPEENLGARMLREAAEKTGDAVGDGTSTSTLVAHAIYADGVRNIAAGASAVDLKRGLERGLAIAVNAIKALSRPVSNQKERVQVATISAHNDSVLGQLVADALEKVGGEGVVTVEEAKGTETSSEVVEGLQFDHGFPHHTL